MELVLLAPALITMIIIAITTSIYSTTAVTGDDGDINSRSNPIHSPKGSCKRPWMEVGSGEARLQTRSSDSEVNCVYSGLIMFQIF